MRRAAVSAAAAIAIVIGSAAISVPAHAAGIILNGPSAATAGQAVEYNVSGDLSGGTVVITDQNGQQYANSAVGMGASSVDLTFFAPSSSGVLNLTAYNNGTPSNTVSLTLGGISTTTTIAAPNVATVGKATQVNVNVVSNNQSGYAPTGQVVVKDGNGATVTTMGLTPNGKGKSYAYWWWTPPAQGSYAFTAYYQGDNVASGSQSATDLVSASTSGSTISLLAPSTMTVGVPVTLTATLVPATLQGSVGFTFNGQPISASIQIKNGQASMQWTPTAAGAAVMGASYTLNGGGSGSTTDKVTIVAGPTQSDVITLIQPGYGNWVNGGTYALGQGTNFTFQAGSLSGAPVVLSETGPCTVSGLTLNVPVGTGQCNLQAKTAGGNGYAPATYGYTVTVGAGQQVATLSAPNSGRVTKGRTYVLEAPGQADTNAGQNIGWKITRGKNSVCKLIYPSDGSVNLKILKKGTCTVVGSAPGVPNQWLPYSVVRTYTS